MVKAYKFWHEILPHAPKTVRYTLCSEIDNFFTDTLQAIITATYKKNKSKQKAIETAIEKLDLLKFFLRVSWEIKALSNKKYIKLSEDLNEVGKMLGGWLKYTKKNSR